MSIVVEGGYVQPYAELPSLVRQFIQNHGDAGMAQIVKRNRQPCQLRTFLKSCKIFLGSIGVPIVEVNTRPLSFQWTPPHSYPIPALFGGRPVDQLLPVQARGCENQLQFWGEKTNPWPGIRCNCCWTLSEFFRQSYPASVTEISPSLIPVTIAK